MSVNGGSGGSDLSSIHWAVVDNDIPMVRRFVELGENINKRTKSNGYSPLHLAAKWNNDLAMMKALLELGADVHVRDSGGWTPLHWAAKESLNPAIVEALLEAGADHRAETKSGRTALDLIEENDALKNTEARWKLNDLSYKK
ncbi:MAG: ankyrin repeat domain-containing protein [Alphaproteobacteria bacterium GM202ARS2]|nr:ankyrin repeat domain-containing protein [Alphaproteobacteria bacterium GM202ARS2]